MKKINIFHEKIAGWMKIICLIKKLICLMKLMFNIENMGNEKNNI